VVLISSSLSVALSVHFARADKPKIAGWMIILSLVFALAFLGIKAMEYHHHFEIKALPGRYYAMADFSGPGAAMFFTLYFFLTGLHGIHVLGGMGCLIWVAWSCFTGRVSAARSTRVELAGMYWHLIDLVWIFLYPLLYLI
jgi:cytochrome c oxidase subunit 3